MGSLSPSQWRAERDENPCLANKNLLSIKYYFLRRSMWNLCSSEMAKWSLLPNSVQLMKLRKHWCWQTMRRRSSKPSLWVFRFSHLYFRSGRRCKLCKVNCSLCFYSNKIDEFSYNLYNHGLFVFIFLLGTIFPE